MTNQIENCPTRGANGERGIKLPRERTLAIKLSVGNLVLSLVCLGVSEFLKYKNLTVATKCSILGWTLFVIACISESLAFRASILFRWVALYCLCMSILLVYYWHSGLVDAGMWIDTLYTYIAYDWFVNFKNPITFSGWTYSYPAFAIYILSHAIAHLLGFSVVGGYGPILGSIALVALLLTALVANRVRGGFWTQSAVIVILAALYSNRLLVQSYNAIIYSYTALVLATMGDGVGGRNRHRWSFSLTSFFVALALLIQYSGFFFIGAPWLALCVLQLKKCSRQEWIMASRHVIFTGALLAFGLMLHPMDICGRLADITGARDRSHSLVERYTARVPDRIKEIPDRLADSKIYWFEENIGGGFLTNIPPLGGGLPWLCLAALAANIAIGGIRSFYYFLAHLLYVTMATVALWLVSDFSDYRSFVWIFSSTFYSILFCTYIPSVHSRLFRIALWSFCVVFAAFNYSDVGRLRDTFLNGAQDGSYALQAYEDLLASVINGDLNARGQDPSEIMVWSPTDPGPATELFNQELAKHGYSASGLVGLPDDAVFPYLTGPLSEVLRKPCIVFDDRLTKLYFNDNPLFEDLLSSQRIGRNSVIRCAKRSISGNRSLGDFESATREGWSLHGDAFGESGVSSINSPLPFQQPISGIRGQYFINSYHNGDAGTGRLASPDFIIRSDWITFYVGGGSDADRLQVRLFVDHEIVRTATGKQSEDARQVYWNIDEYRGRHGHIEIIDESVEPWGHIIADDFRLLSIE